MLIINNIFLNPQIIEYAADDHNNFNVKAVIYLIVEKLFFGKYNVVRILTRSLPVRTFYNLPYSWRLH